MSHDAVDDAIFVSDLAPQAKLVLVALAQHAHRKSGRCHPSTARLAGICGLRDRQVREYLAALQQSGLVLRDDAGKGGRGVAARFRLDLDRLRKAAEQGRADLKARRRSDADNVALGRQVSGKGNVAAGRHVSGPKPGAGAPINPALERQQNQLRESVSGDGRPDGRPLPSTESGVPTTPPAPLEGGEGQRPNSFPHLAMGGATKPNFPGTDLKSGFEEFWDAYPRKVCKRDAVKAWGSLKPDAELLVDILVAVAQAKARNLTWRERDAVPYPATWLRGQRWTDELPETGKSPIIRSARHAAKGRA